MDGPIDNLRAFEVGVSLHSPLMPDSLRRVLNPTVFTVQNASYLPTLHLSEQRERCNPVYVKYQFHCLPEHRTAGHAHSRDITWNDSHIVLLGTIDQELLAECLRGPPLVMEVHDRDRCLDGGEPETVFGAERRDELLGTHAFGAGMKVSETVRGLCCPWDSFGMACFNLDDLLDGHHMLQLTTPITTGPRAPPSREDCRVGPHGRELPSPLPPGDYLDSQSYLTITIELSHPLSITPSHPHTITSTTNTASPEVPLTSCPFTRLVYVTSSDDAGLSLVRRILDYVNENNTAALGLTELPKEMLMTALSTYKLTKCQVEGGRCDVVTGFQVRDREVSVLVVEGLRHGAILRLWTQLPRHASQDPGLVKVFYNSCYSFSRRKYGSLDVDLPLISLPHSLSSLTQLPLVYVRGNVTPAALQALLCLTEITRNRLGGMAELVRSGLFPSVEEISALAMQFGILPGEDGLEGNIKHSEGALSGSHTPIPVVREGEGGRRERVKMPLDMTNSDYESVLADRKRHLPIDHINGNITHTRTLSEQSARLSANRRCHRTRRRAQTDTQPIHIYSSQTLNTAVLAKSRMRAKLATSSEHTHQLYTYCQDYQSMTFEPVDTQSENKSQRLASRQKWRTREGFVYPRVPSTRESNTPQHCPNPAHISEPYTDGLLHANTLKPTVDRLHFSWEQRRDDFDRYSCLPKEFGPSLPISIHLAGQRRAAEARLSDELAKREWEKKVVVNDSRFHTYRRGIRTELHAKPGTQLSRLEDILKSPPVKYSLRQDSLRLEPIPPLDVVQNQGHCNSYSNCTSKQTEGEGERCGGGGYQPGQSEKGSLKRDGNVTPLRYQQMHNSSEGWRVKHRHNFRLFYHTHSPLSKRAILSLSPSEKHPPLFTTPSTTQ